MDESKILITGANGQLGRALQERYPKARKTDSAELDITDRAAVDNFNWADLEIIINTAAYTNVDGAETPEGRVSAWRVNSLGTANLASAALKHGLTLVHISTEYVFDGTQNPHKEDEPLSPLSVYGASKAAGETAAGLVDKHYVLRTSWLIGEGKNFVRTMLGLGKKGISPSVVSDQTGRLTFTSELVSALDHLLAANSAFGIYNVSNEGDIANWADVTRAIFKEADFDLKVTDITTKQYFADKPEAAKRPLNSGFDLSKLKAAGFQPRDWREDLADYIKKEKNK